MSAQAPGYNTAPSDKETPEQDRGLFHHEAKKHESHHYVRMYGGQAVNAMMWGFGATLGADAANAAVGDMKVYSTSIGSISRQEKVVGGCYESHVDTEMAEKMAS